MGGVCDLTYELRGRNRRGAWPARRMMTQDASRAKCHAGGGPWLERRVRRQPCAAEGRASGRLVPWRAKKLMSARSATLLRTPYRIRRCRAARSMYDLSFPSSFLGAASQRLERRHARAPFYIRSFPMSALLAAIDCRLERLFRILEKGTLDGRRVRGDGN